MLASRQAQVASNLGWSFLNTALTRLANIVTGIALARMLTPSDFGVFAIAFVVAQALLELNGAGVANAVLRADRPTPQLLSVATTISLVSGLCLCVLGVLAAPLLAAAVDVPAVANVVRVLALLVLIDGLSAVPAAVLARRFRQDQRLLADGLGVVVASAVTIATAASGAGVWSFVVGRVAGNATAATIVVWRAGTGTALRPEWDVDVAVPLLRFGLPLMGGVLISFAVVNLDYVVVGHQLGVATLGVYVVAFNLASLPVGLLSMAIRRVSIGAFASGIGQNSVDVLVALRILTWCSALLVAITIAVASPLINVIYGQRWHEAAAVLAILIVMGAARVVINLMVDALVAAGRTGVVMVVYASWLCVLVVALPIGVMVSDIVGVAWAQALVAVMLVLPMCLIMTARASSFSLKSAVTTLTLSTLSTTAGAAAGRAVASRGGDDFGSLVLGALAAAGVFSAFLAGSPDGRSLWRRSRERLRKRSACDTPSEQGCGAREVH